MPLNTARRTSRLDGGDKVPELRLSVLTDAEEITPLRRTLVAMSFKASVSCALM
jgi:hypothetical protein